MRIVHAFVAVVMLVVAFGVFASRYEPGSSDRADGGNGPIWCCWPER